MCRMEIRYGYDKFRITASILGFLIFFVMGWVLLCKLEIFKKEVFIKYFFVLIGVFFLSIMILQIITFTILLFRKTPAIIITEEYLIDNSKYYSFGKIPWNKITSINVIKHSNNRETIELVLSSDFSNQIKLDILKKILLWLDNYGDKSKIVLRNTFIDSEMEEFKNKIIITFSRVLDGSI